MSATLVVDVVEVVVVVGVLVLSLSLCEAKMAQAQASDPIRTVKNMCDSLVCVNAGDTLLKSFIAIQEFLKICSIGVKSPKTRLNGQNKANLHSATECIP